MSQIIQLQSAASETSPAVESDPIHIPIHTDSLYVLITSIDETPEAVRIGSELSKKLGVPLTLVHLRTVPYALPIDARNGLSPVETDAFVHRLGEVARETGVDVRVRVCLCRDVERAIPLVVKRHSLIVIAGRRSWWPTRTERLRRVLEGTGHFVVLVDKAGHQDRARASSHPRR